jgi:hypothetical protein
MNSLKIDLSKMTKEYGLPTEDVIHNGKVMMRDEPVWNSEALRRAVGDVKAMAAQDSYDQVEILAHCPNWVTTALTYAAAPAKGLSKVGPGGKYVLDLHPFPVGDIDPSLGIHFDVQEQGDRVYVTLIPNANADEGAHGFDLERYEEITVPAVPAGKVVLLAGEMVNPVAVSLALSYAKDAKAIYLRFHQAEYYYCSITNDPEIQIGDMIAAE